MSQNSRCTGSGKTPTQEVDKKSFVSSVLKVLDIEKPIIVAASSAGYYALPYVLQPSPSTCEQRVQGLVTVGLVGADLFTPSQYHRCDVRIYDLCLS